MNLNKRPVIDPRWIQSVQPTLDGFLNCEIELLDVKLDHRGTGYDWKTNQNASAPPTVLFAGPAQFQVYRFTLTMDAPVGSVEQVRSGRFTINMEDIGPELAVRKGQMIRMTSCPNDPSLTHYEYVVNSGLNSGLGFRRTIETEINMSRVTP